jgi:hypothetical protein
VLKINDSFSMRKETKLYEANFEGLLSFVGAGVCSRSANQSQADQRPQADRDPDFD